MAISPFKSRIIADVGISFGDEGKGRVVYEVLDHIERTEPEATVAMVLKTNGGANSGHTAGGLKHNLLPCGIADSRIPILALGSGVVADPRKIWWEVEAVESKGYDVIGRLKIDERTQVSDLSHRLLDLGWEYYRSFVLGSDARGSTGRGITPAFSDEVNQWQIFFDDFRHGKDTYATKLSQRFDRTLNTLEHVCQMTAEGWEQCFRTLTEAETRANQGSIDSAIFPEDEFDFSRFLGEKPFEVNLDVIVDTYWEAGSSLIENIIDVREAVLKATDENHYIIAEFGQSYWLDKRHGFSPNVTASHSFTPEFFQSAGVPLQTVHTVGVAKAYDTKVGTHLFLTEMEEGTPISNLLKKLEFGTSTGRQRMVGWYDAVEKGSALRYGGYDDLVINKIDALTLDGDWTGPLKICTAYQDGNGNLYYQVPRNEKLRSSLKPVYKELPGWTEDLSGITSFSDLPKNAKIYIAWMMKSLWECANHGLKNPKDAPNLRFIGVGPEPSQIISDVPDSSDLLKLISP